MSACKKSHQKLLSIVVTGRNDNYMGNFKYRLSTCINYLAWNLEKLEQLDFVEILVTDWNSSTPLSKDLIINQSATQITRFVCVPPSIATTKLNDGQVFNTPCAINTSIRRALGTYIMHLCSDTLVPLRSIQTILDLLNREISLPVDIDKSLFLSQWYSIPPHIIKTEPSLEEWDYYLLMNARRMTDNSQPTGLGIGSSCWLMHRSLWHESQGYDERYSRWGWSDADLTVRICQKYPWVEMAVLGVSMFEMEHSRVRSDAPINLPFLNPNFSLAYADWGLGSYQLDIQSSPCTGILSADPGINLKQFSNKTPNDLIQEITSKQVVGIVNHISELFKLSTDTYASMVLIAWYALHYSPRNYLEFDLKQGYYLVLLASICSDIQISAIVDTSFPNQDDHVLFGDEIPAQVDGWQSGVIPYETKFLLKYSVKKYFGYLRYITGSLDTAIKRLRASTIDKMQMDLILFHVNSFEINFIEQLDKSLSLLESGGIIIITSSNQNEFLNLWEGVKEVFTDVTFIELLEFPTGAILKSRLKNQEKVIRLNLKNLCLQNEYESSLDVLNTYEFREINLVGFINWDLSETLIREELDYILSKVILHPQSQKISLFLESRDYATEEMHLLVSSSIMEIISKHLIEDDTLLPHMMFLGDLKQVHWQKLLPKLTGCLPFKYMSPLSLVLTHSSILPLWQ